jgi:outer membrane lipoprotein-sorting protein
MLIMLRRVVIIAAVLVAVVAAFWGARPRTAQLSSGPRLKSYHARTKSTRQQTGKKAEIDYREDWYEYPDKERSESLEGGRVELGRIVNGEQYVTYSAITGYAVSEPSGTETVAQLRKRASQFRPLSEIPKSSDYRVVGTEKILGRVCDKVKTDLHSKWQKGEWVTCIDRESGFPLRMANIVNGTVESEELVTELQTNQPIPKSVFDASDISGVRIIRSPIADTVLADEFVMKPSEFLSTGGMTFEKLSPASDALSRLAKSIEGQHDNGKRKIDDVFAPSYVPVRFKLAAARPRPFKAKTEKGFSVSYGGEFNAVEIAYVDPKTGDALILVESAEKLEPGKEPLKKGGFSGEITRATSPFPYIILTWKEKGTHILLGGVNVEEKELLKVAKSLQVLSE